VGSLDRLKAAAESFCQANMKTSMLMLFEVDDSRGNLLSFIGDPMHILEDKLKAIGPAQSQTCSISSTISYVLTIINKFRMKNGTDRFGHGRSPWIIEPVNIIVFTEGLKNDEEVSFVKTSGTGGDMVAEPYRWDQRFYFTVMCPERPIDPLGLTDQDSTIGIQADTDENLHAEITSVAGLSGGEVLTYNDLAGVHALVSTLSEKVAVPSVAVKIVAEEVMWDQQLSRPSGMYPPSYVMTRLLVKNPGEWPLPEPFWVDTRTESLPTRPAQPVLQVLPVDASTKAHLQLAKELDIHIDVYEVVSVPAASVVAVKSQSVHKMLGLQRSEFYAVCVRGSARKDTQFGAALKGSSIANAASAEPPCAILGPGKIGGNAELFVLPYNYPHFFKVVKYALDQLNKLQAVVQGQQQSQQLSSAQLQGAVLKQAMTQPWVQAWRTEVNSYLASTPPYYYAATLHRLKHLNLLVLANIPTDSTFKLNRAATRLLNHFKDNAGIDIAAMEDMARSRVSRLHFLGHGEDIVARSPVEVATLSDCAVGQLAPWEVPSSLMDLPPSQYLGMWERMRRSIFGGGAGLTTRGLAASHVEATGGSVPAPAPAPRGKERDKMKDKDKDKDAGSAVEKGWLTEACGGFRAPQLSTRAMGDFFRVLSRQETLRDPALEAHAVDEDLPRERLKRKLAVNFGNRFRNKSAKQGREVDGMVTLMSASGGILTLGMEKMDDISGDISGLLKEDKGEAGAGTYRKAAAEVAVDGEAVEVDDIFLDTPAPHRGSEPPSPMPMPGNYTEETDHPDNAHPKESVPAKVPRNLTVLPPLGKPRLPAPKASSSSHQRSRHGSLEMIAASKALTEAGGVGVAFAEKGESSDDGFAYAPMSPATLPSGVHAGLGSPGSGSGSGETSACETLSVSESDSESVSGKLRKEPKEKGAPRETKERALKPGWEKHYSKRTDRTYWFHAQTGQSSWEEPLEDP
jgi:hypothetical protein